MQKSIVNKLTAPIIVCGMHRSGTSLISRVLNDVGVFMGTDLEVNNEPLSFLLLNDKLLELTHSYWDQIDGAFHFFDNQEAVEQASHLLKTTYLNQDLLKNFFGKKRYKSPPQVWGWKDPRNTVTFPLWQSVFPEAKFVFVYRNGIDSAASLVKREQTQEFDINIPAYSSRCLTIDSAFSLWEDNNNFFLKHKNVLNSANLIEIKYEDFLEQPLENIESLIKFCDIDSNTVNTEGIAAKVNNTRAYSFLNNEELTKFYSKVKDNAIMQKLGYNKINHA